MNRNNNNNNYKYNPQGLPYGTQNNMNRNVGNPYNAPMMSNVPQAQQGYNRQAPQHYAPQQPFNQPNASYNYGNGPQGFNSNVNSNFVHNAPNTGGIPFSQHQQQQQQQYQQPYHNGKGNYNYTQQGQTGQNYFQPRNQPYRNQPQQQPQQQMAPYNTNRQNFTHSPNMYNNNNNNNFSNNSANNNMNVGGFTRSNNYGDRSNTWQQFQRGQSYYNNNNNNSNNNGSTFNNMENNNYGNFRGRGGYRGRGSAGGRGRAGGNMNMGANYGYGHSYSRNSYNNINNNNSGGGGAFNSQHDVYHLVHLDSFAQVDEVGRRGTFNGIVPDSVLLGMHNKARGSSLRVLVIVSHQYLAACLSVPTRSEDVVLSQATAQEFLDISHALSDDGGRLVDLRNGAHVARHVFQQMRNFLTQLTSFDKQASEEKPSAEDVFNMDSTMLITEMNRQKCYFDAIKEALKEDSERSTTLFVSLLTQQSKSESEEEEKEEKEEELPTQPNEKENSGNERKEKAEKANADEENGVANSNAPTSKESAKTVATLLNSAPGAKLLEVCLMQPAKRGAFFHLLLVESRSDASEGRLFRAFFSGLLTAKLVFDCFDIDPFGTLAKSGHLPSSQLHRADEMKILCDNFARHGITVVCGDGGTCMLAAIVQALRPNYVCYEQRNSLAGGRGRSHNIMRGERAGKEFGTDDNVEKNKTTSNSEDVSSGVNHNDNKVDTVSTSNINNENANTSSSATLKRGREEEGGEDDDDDINNNKNNNNNNNTDIGEGDKLSEKNANNNWTTNDEDNRAVQQRKLEENAKVDISKEKSNNNNNNNESNRSLPTVPKSLSEFTVPSSPTDWSFFYAVAAAFTSGAISGESATSSDKTTTTALENNNEKSSNNDNSLGMTVDAAKVGARVELLSHHIVACRALQILLPHLADAILTHAKQQEYEHGKAIDETTNENNSTNEALLFIRRGEVMFSEIVKRAKELMIHNYGNYVIQTFITEMAPRAIPSTFVEQSLNTVIEAIIDNIFEVSVQKYASNCVERALSASAILTNGHKMVIRMARAMISRGPPSMLEVASSQYGNYVIRHLCERLTAIATQTSSESTATINIENVTDAKELELQFYKTLRARAQNLHNTHYGVGLVNWIQSQQTRLESIANKA